jgi:energy-coupling factor transporter transmembrane protein EcfT
MLLPFFERLEDLAFSIWLRESWFAVPVVNVMHLLALVMVFGAVLVVDIRLLGRGMSQQSVAQVARDARPWLIGGLVCMLLTGIPQLLSIPIREYYSPFFWMKMRLLLVALVFTFTLRHKVAMADEEKVGPVWGKVVGLVSIALWTWVAIEGRLIGVLS